MPAACRIRRLTPVPHRRALQSFFMLCPTKIWVTPWERAYCTIASTGSSASNTSTLSSSSASLRRAFLPSLSARFLGRVRTSHINRQNIAMKTRRALPGACDHAIGVCMSRQADQKAFLCLSTRAQCRATASSVAVRHQLHPQREPVPFRGERTTSGGAPSVGASTTTISSARIEKLPRDCFNSTGLPVSFSDRLALVVDVLQVH